MSRNRMATSALVGALEAYKESLKAERSTFSAWCHSNTESDMARWLQTIGRNERLSEVVQEMETSNLPMCVATPEPEAASGPAMAVMGAENRLRQVHNSPDRVLYAYRQAMMTGQQSPQEVATDLDFMVQSTTSLDAYKEHYAASIDATSQALTDLISGLTSTEDVQTEALSAQRSILMSKFSSEFIEECQNLYSRLPHDTQELFAEMRQAEAVREEEEVAAAKTELLQFMAMILRTRMSQSN